MNLEITTKRLKLVPCTEENAYIFLNDYPEEEHIQSYLEVLNQNPNLLGWGVWFILLKKENKMIGDMGFKGRPSSDGSVEIGYGILPSYQNQGYATEAANALIDWCFSTDEVDKVKAECEQTNDPSIKVLNKCGLRVYEMRNNMFYLERKKSD